MLFPITYCRYLGLRRSATFASFTPGGFLGVFVDNYVGVR
jgi:hypothetical protein